MARWHGMLLGRLLVASLAVNLAFGPNAAAAACRWTVVPSQDVGDSGFNGISIVSPSEAWAAGIATDHWDGHAWKAVPTPNIAQSGLWGVSDLSRGDAWVAGDYAINNQGRTLTEHWDGHAWTVIPSPNASQFDHILFAIYGISTSDVWVAGRYSINGSDLHYHTLIEHWNGTTWTIVPSPSPGNDSNRLSGISAVSPSDVWAVGYFDGSNDFTNDTLTEHWDGHAWTVIPSPNTYFRDSDQLLAVSARTSSDVWAVGWYSNSRFAHTLVEHWNGHAWKVIPSPQPPGNTANQLTGVSAISASDAWAVGYSIKSDNSRAAFSEHWDGHVWTVVPTVNPGTTSVLDGVSGISATNIWTAGGYVGTDGHVHSLIELWKC